MAENHTTTESNFYVDALSIIRKQSATNRVHDLFDIDD